MSSCELRVWGPAGPPRSVGRAVWVLLLLQVAATACDTPAAPDLDAPLEAGALRAHLNFLAADAMRGRRAGSEYERRAADYIRDRLVSYDLAPGSPDYFQGFAIPVAVDGQPGLSSRNVIGVLPGIGELAGEWVVVGAHYDHLGWTLSGDSVVVFNGADDNASGVALLLEVARVLSGLARSEELRETDRRSVMFHAYGAEEVGLVGSFHYCNHPTVARDSIVAMLNFDMVGRLGGNGLFLIGASSSPEWPVIVGEVNDEGTPVAYSDQFLNRSDQFCFYQGRTPVLLFHTGLHSQYHTPQDDVSLIDVEGMVRVGNLAIDALVDLLLRPEPPSFSGGASPTVDSAAAVY